MMKKRKIGDCLFGSVCEWPLFSGRFNGRKVQLALIDSLSNSSLFSFQWLSVLSRISNLNLFFIVYTMMIEQSPMIARH